MFTLMQSIQNLLKDNRTYELERTREIASLQGFLKKAIEQFHGQSQAANRRETAMTSQMEQGFQQLHEVLIDVYQRGTRLTTQQAFLKSLLFSVA